MSEENNSVEVAELTEEQMENLTPKDVDFDGKAVEEAMIEAANQRAIDPTEMAATAYSMYSPHYRRLLGKMSTRGLRRVLNYLVLYPLEQEDIKNANELEKEFMYLCNYLAEAKFVMIMDQYRANAEKLLEAQETPLTKEEETAIIDEVSNKEKTNG